MNNKVTLSQEDKDSIRRQQDFNPVVKYLRGKDRFNFAVGDFLIRLNQDYDGNWSPETVSTVSKVPKRFQCIYEDEFGVKYIKPLTSKGEKLPNVMILTDIVDRQIYQVDPDYAEHMILNGEDDFNWAEQKKAEKKNRERITRLNKKLLVNTKTVTDIDEFLKKLTVGAKIWQGWTIPSAAESSPRIVTKIEEIDISSLGSWERQQVEPGRHKTWRVTYADGRSFRSEELLGVLMLDREPYKYETL